ncbi:MAG: glutamate-5-semialdehyde dehydrogenase, partial [Fibrobacterota bacterium]
MAKDLSKYSDKITRAALAASEELVTAGPAKKNKALRKTASLLWENRNKIKKANERDLAEAKKNGLSESMIDRLRADEKVIKKMMKGLREVAAQKDPVGEKFDSRKRPNGLRIEKMRVPIGVIFIIFESRPNVTIDSAALCLISGNATILRGGKEAINTNLALASVFSEGLKSCGLSPDCVQIVNTPDRAVVPMLLGRAGEIDLVIPRGGEKLIEAVVRDSKIPVLKHYKGVCHLYLAEDCNKKMGINMAVNAKTQRPGVCNALETLLLDEKLSAAYVQKVISVLKENGVTVY